MAQCGERKAAKSRIKSVRQIEVKMYSFDSWREELLFVGKIIQDSDDSVDPEESERRFNRYTEMLDALEGNEGYEFALAVFESIQSIHDYGAYQTAGRAAWKFGERLFCIALLAQLPRLISDLPDWAGDFLVSIANGEGTEYQSTIDMFNLLLCELPLENQLVIRDYIREQENSGWLEDRVRVLANA